MTLIKDMIAMIRDLQAAVPAVGRWGFALNVPMWVGGLIFFGSTAGRVVFVLNMLAVMIAAQIHKRRRFSRLTSICHLVWLPALPYIWFGLVDVDGLAGFRVWLLYTAVTMAISLVLDVRNLILYWGSNDRAFFVAGTAEEEA